MKLKCIGGEQDGLILYVEDCLRYGDFVKVPEKIKTATMFNPDIELIVTKQLIYKISVLHFTNDDSLKFLIPENWTDRQALLFQFGK